jgi:hypothetical protein
MVVSLRNARLKPARPSFCRQGTGRKFPCRRPSTAASSLRHWKSASVRRRRACRARRPEHRSHAGRCRQSLCAHAPPHRSCFGIRITRGEQQLCLVCAQCRCWFVSRRPPLEVAFRQTLCGDPKPLPVIREDPDRLTTAAAKDKQAARKRIGREFFRAELRQRIYALLPSMASIATRIRSCGVI